MLVQHLGKCMSEQMIVLLAKEVVEVVGMREGALAEAVEVEVEAVKGMGVVESVSKIN
jgi:hypothetical protein